MDQEVASRHPEGTGPVDRAEQPAHAEHTEHPRHDHDALAAVFRALAEPARLQIVHSLSGGEQRVTDLTGKLGLAQSTTSAHLATLRGCGLVNVRSQGRASYYSLATPALVALVHHAEELIDHGLHVVVHDHGDAINESATPPSSGTQEGGPHPTGTPSSDSQPAGAQD